MRSRIDLVHLAKITSAFKLLNVFSSIGLGIFVFGRRQGRPIHLLAGLLLMVMPYLVANPWALGLVCVAVLVAPLLLPT